MKHITAILIWGVVSAILLSSRIYYMSQTVQTVVDIQTFLYMFYIVYIIFTKRAFQEIKLRHPTVVYMQQGPPENSSD